MKTPREIRLQSRRYLKLQHDSVVNDRNARNFREMAFATKMIYDKKLHLSFSENNILRNSLRNFSAICYKQQKELVKLQKQIQKQKQRQNQKQKQRQKRLRRCTIK